MTSHVCGDQLSRFILRRLNASSPVSEAAGSALHQVIRLRPAVLAHTEIEVDSCAAFLVRGLASRVRHLSDGRRQLTSFLVPGDLCDYGFLNGCRSSTRIFTLAESVVAEVSMPQFLTVCERYPEIMRALLRSTALETAVADERIVSLGLRTAIERLGHLFCELHERLDIVGLASKGTFDFPATQAELAEGLGMSAVHVNRTLQELRREKFLTFQRGRIHILDQDGLSHLSGYDAGYLQ